MFKAIPFLCVLALLFANVTLWGQLLTPQAVNAGGTSNTAGSLLLESSIGGLVVQDVSNPVFIYTPDFHQPFAGTTTISPHMGGSGGGVRLESGAGIDNAGMTMSNTQSGNNIMIEFTVGEMASTTLLNNHMLTQGILQPFTQNNNPLPVLGLEFFAKRLNTQQVQLDWKTLQEMNNKGFAIERKRDNDTAFVKQRFVHTKVTGGNSSLPLQYVQLDTNNYNGRSYYRLKQEDMNGRFIYSVVRLVTGEHAKTITLKAWPLPAKDFFVSASGITKDVLQVFDASGRMTRQINITGNEVVGINGLAPGTYFLKLNGHKDLVQKVVVE